VPSCRPFGTVAYRGRCVNADLPVALRAERRSLARPAADARSVREALQPALGRGPQVP
jgi:hypothetical protein